MAKYLLGRDNYVQCSVLDENCLANTYTVKFTNGIVKNVDKRKVYNLDRIDEGVLDKLKSFGKSLLDKVLKPIGKYIYLAVNGVTTGTLFNTMIAAESKRGMGFYPSEAFVDVCEKYGVEPSVSEDTTAEDRERRILNSYWKNVMSRWEDDDVEDDVELATESYRVSSFKTRNSHRLNEGNDSLEGYSLDGAEGGWAPINTKEAIKYIFNQYSECARKGAGKRTAAQQLVPMCLWGAPGIGKTAIIKGLVRDLNKTGAAKLLNGIQGAGRDVNIILLNAMTMRKDDFSFPVAKEVKSKFLTPDGEEYTAEHYKAVDVIKSIIPSYSISQLNKRDDALTEDILDDIANGGDGSGNGLGGIIFIDELSRIAKETMDVIMTLIQSRQLGDSFIGSKWVFVAAANGIDDMGNNAEEVSWEAAYTGRFESRRYVPTYPEWREWAISKGEDGRQNIEQIYIDFLDEHHTKCWYNPSMNNKTDDLLAQTLYPTPRSYGLATASYRKTTDAYDDYKKDPRQKEAADLLGFGDEYGRTLTKRERDKFAEDALRYNGGDELRNTFNSWNTFDGRFTTAVAKNVWKTGSIGSTSFVIDDSNAVRALQKILQTHPKYSTVGDNKTTIDITPKEMENFIRGMCEIADAAANSGQQSREALLKVMFKQATAAMIRHPFDINLEFEKDKGSSSKYDKALDIYRNAIVSNDVAIANRGKK